MYWILPVILAAVVLFLTFAYNQNNRPDITAYDMSVRQPVRWCTCQICTPSHPLVF